MHWEALRENMEWSRSCSLESVQQCLEQQCNNPPTPTTIVLGVGVFQLLFHCRQSTETPVTQLPAADRKQ
jgi:hypothetical protein